MENLHGLRILNFLGISHTSGVKDVGTSRMNPLQGDYGEISATLQRSYRPSGIFMPTVRFTVEKDHVIELFYDPVKESSWACASIKRWRPFT